MSGLATLDIATRLEAGDYSREQGQYSGKSYNASVTSLNSGW
jgi:hypothetical protein